MKIRSTIILVSVVLLFGYLMFWPVPIEPQPWQAPTSKGLTGAHQSNRLLAAMTLLPLAGRHGPEDVAVDRQGRITVSTHNGDILRSAPNGNSPEWQVWTNTGGRPLGIEYNRQDELVVADAMRGLLVVRHSGEVDILTNQVEGSPIGYADDVDIARDGKIYFSDASTRFPARHIGDTLEASLLDLMEHSGSGRLLMYDPATGVTSRIIGGLNFANGVALTHDESAVLVVETGSYRILRVILQGERAGRTEVFHDNLPGFPDNLQRSQKGFWVGLAAPRSAVIDTLSDYPRVRAMIQRLPAFMRPQAAAYGHLIRLSNTGEVTADLQDPSGKYPMTTGALEHEGFLYISSLVAPALARLPIEGEIE